MRERNVFYPSTPFSVTYFANRLLPPRTAIHLPTRYNRYHSTAVGDSLSEASCSPRFPTRSLTIYHPPTHSLRLSAIVLSCHVMSLFALFDLPLYTRTCKRIRSLPPTHPLSLRFFGTVDDCLAHTSTTTSSCHPSTHLLRSSVRRHGSLTHFGRFRSIIV